MHTWQYCGTQVVKLYNIEKKHDHWLCKGIGLHGKRSPNDWNTISRKSPNTVEEVMEISHDKIPPMPEKSAFMFHHNFYPNLKVELKDTDIS